MRKPPSIIAALGLAAALVPTLQFGVDHAREEVSFPYALAAFAPLPTPASRVLTLEGGFVGLQNFAYFTPQQLRGDLCKAPNTCQPVDYPALPGNNYDEAAAVNVENAIAALPENERIILFGHSQGGEVIYSNLLRWKENPDTAPDPSRVTWVSIGNPENALGGVTTKFPFPTKPAPTDTKYQGIEVIHQYDGWADAPDNPFNLLAVLNAIVGSQSYHLNYWDVDLNDPNNVVFTPDQPDGTPGNVTYVYVPAKVIPLVKDTGFLAPILDQWLRPIIEAGYNRPVEIPSPNAPKNTPPAAVTDTSAVLAAESVPTAPTVAPVPDIAAVSSVPEPSRPQVTRVAPEQNTAEVILEEQNTAAVIVEETSPELETTAVVRRGGVTPIPSVEDTLPEPVASAIDIDTEASAIDIDIDTDIDTDTEASDATPVVKSDTPAVNSDTPAVSADPAPEKRSSERGSHAAGD